MPEKNSKKAAWLGKCPRCHQGDIFKYPLTNIRHFAAMNNTCPVCGVTFEPEPGFYFGAMYVSYAISVALLVAIAAVLYVFFNPSDLTYLIAISIGAVLFTPVSFRYSRILFLHWFGGIHYDPNLK